MRAAVDDVIDRALECQKVTGTVVLVFQDGKPVFQRAAGFADREAKVSVKFDTIFRMASVTKSIVAATSLALVERDLIRLTDPVALYLPWFRPPLPDGGRPNITIHQLLTHTSGLAYDPKLEGLAEGRALTMGFCDTDLDYESNFSRHNAIPLPFTPGSKWTYSFSTDILGAVVAQVHGGTLEEAVIHYVAGPLGMNDSRFHVTDLSRLAIPYGDAKPIPVRMPEKWVGDDLAGWMLSFSPKRLFNPKAFQSGGGGMVGTPGDIISFLEMLRVGGSGILGAAIVQAGLTNQIAGLEGGEPGVKFGYFGAVVEDPILAMTPQSAGTVRWGGVYGLDWFMDREKQLTALTVTNNALEGCTGAYPVDIRNAIYAGLSR